MASSDLGSIAREILIFFALHKMFNIIVGISLLSRNIIKYSNAKKIKYNDYLVMFILKIITIYYYV